MLAINRVIRNFLSVGFSNLISQIIAFLVVTHYARVLGKSDFGIINLAQSILMYFTLLTFFGLQTYGTREISKNKTNAIVGEIITIRIFIAFLSFFVIALIAFFINRNSNFKIILLLYGITLFPNALNLDWVFAGLQEMHHNAVYNIIKSLIPFIIVILFLKSSSEIKIIPISTFIGLSIGTFYQIFIYLTRQKHGLKFKISYEKAVQYLKFGLPFLVSGLLAMVNNNVDRIIMGFSRPEGEIGLYSAAYNIIMFLMNIIAIIFMPIFPLFISYYHQNKREELQNLSNAVARIVILIAIPISLGGAFLSKDIILLLYGFEYYEAYKPFVILLIYILFLFLRETFGYQLNAWGREREYLKVVAISSLLNFIMNLIFIPKYGMNIAAFITVMTEFINFYLMRKYASEVIITPYAGHIVRIMPPTAIMIICVLTLSALKVHVITNILSAILVYFAMIILFKYISIDELRTIILKKNEA